MTDDWPMKSAQICFAISERKGLHKGSFLEHCSDGIVALTLLGRIRTPAWVPFQAAALAVSHTLSSTRTRHASTSRRRGKNDDAIDGRHDHD